MNIRNSIIVAALITIAALGLNGCRDTGPGKNEQADKAQQAANSIVFTANAEIDNIKKRIELTSKPGALGFIILLNDAGQPILYEGVEGKVTSGGKRLTAPDRLYHYGLERSFVRASPSDEGTWGSSSPYIFYWNTEGVYRQWSGQYLYSDKPFRLRIDPLVINLSPEKK
jgi:hypothetical protein